ncbi:hypothetical protein BJ170DRAFT_159415 [Xylariales sp. AK1849]|nr:hypothetical protein BJ170DRAFT_159415 [Xylariales sp. AK1849]
MNQIRSIQTLNKRELEAGIHNPNASWHVDYRDTAFINFGGLPFNLSEGDVLTIFSQYGEPTFLKLARDKETGKSRGFGWLKYEDQRSTDLAVDNLGGAEIGGRLVRVDHARYRSRDDEDDEECHVGWEDIQRREGKGRGEKSDVSETEEDEPEPTRSMIKEEIELARLISDHDEDDPMKAFLIEEKKKEVEVALQRRDEKDRNHKHRYHHHKGHRSRKGESGREDSGGRDKESRKRSRRDKTPVADERRRDGTRAAEERDRKRRGDHRDRDGDRPRDRDHRRNTGHLEEYDGHHGERRRKQDQEDQDRERRSRRRSRSRSPRSHRDR